MTAKTIGCRCVVLGLAILALRCAAVTPTPPAPERAEAVVRVATFQDRLLLTGELKAIRADPVIVPRTPSWQMPIRWMAADGATVEKGEKVLELDNAQFSGELEQTRLAESAALNSMNQKEADISVDLADKRFAVDQARILWKKAALEADVPDGLRARREQQEKELEETRKEVAHEKALENLHAAEEAADAELDELRIALDKARTEVRTSEEAIAQLDLVAPATGILVVAENGNEGRKFQVGDNVWVGLAVMQIPELSAMKVEALLSDVDDGRVTPGMRARCVLDTYPDRSFEGKVVDIAPIAKQQGRRSMRRAFRAVIHLDESDPELMRPGMSVRAEILPRPQEQVLVVPRDTLDFDGDVPRVLTADGGAVEVTLGACGPDTCVITGGVEQGLRLRRRS